jgi:hypothetical protein
LTPSFFCGAAPSPSHIKPEVECCIVGLPFASKLLEASCWVCQVLALEVCPTEFSDVTGKKKWIKKIQR